MFRRALPWIGLGLFAVSFAAFVLWTAPLVPVVKTRPPAPKGREPMVVVLDPGHGGKDSGAMCGGVMEKDLTLDVALRTELLLRAAGFTTVLTRDADRYLSLAERAEVGNDEKHSLFVSIHFNDGERSAASGVETYFAAHQAAVSAGLMSWLGFFRSEKTAPLGAESENLARLLQASLVEHTRAVDRGTKTAQFYVIRNVRHPAALVEGGFINNPADATKLATEKYRQQIAGAISDGICRYRTAQASNEPTLALAAPAE